MPKAYSLIELLIALAILALIMTFAFPVYQGVLASQRERLANQRLYRAINFARSEAITKGRKVRFCLSKDQLSCSRGPAKGFIIMANQRVLKSFTEQVSGYWLWRGLRNSDGVTFLPEGQAAENGSFRYCQTTCSSVIIVNQMGGIRQQ